MNFKSFISGCQGLRLSDDERAFFADHRPVGLILFARNCEDKTQVRKLTDAFRESVGDPTAFVLIDQEGGRVQRLRPPHWRDYPSGRQLGKLLEKDWEEGGEAVQLITKLLASELVELGINVDCLPVLDIPVPGADDIIGDRAYGENADIVSRAGRVVSEALIAAGVLPVIKHIPGHGRALCDSHKDLPVISCGAGELEGADYLPFKSLNDMPLAMTAHVLLPHLDTEQPVSTSQKIIDEVIRRDIGFDGVLMSDDLSMHALSGSMEQRTSGVLDAGCDLALHCNGVMDEMAAVAEAAHVLDGDALLRVKRAFDLLTAPQVFDRERAEHLRLSVLSA